MKNIKVRAWDKLNKKMIEVNNIDFRYNRIHFLDSPSIFGAQPYLDFDDLVLMWATIFMDKKGELIYEGDIVMVESSKEKGLICIGFDGNPNDFYYHFHIKWMPRNYARTELPFWTVERNIEIVGNKYENPELLIPLTT